MKEINSIKELHDILLDMGKTFHQICVKNGITYYMLGGTMLGAKRHQGFIPWDDDMDFGIPRAQLPHAIEILRSQLPKQYALVTYKESKDNWGEIIKLGDTRTLVNAQGHEDERKTGVFIDIFPLDYAENTNTGTMSLNMFIYRWLQCDRFARNGGGNFIIRCISKLLGKDFFVRNIKRLVSRKGRMIANYSGMWGIREIVPKDYFGTPVLYPFEDTKLYGVAKAHEYLTNLYNDYMQLPPESKRHTHIKDICWQ